MKMKRSMKKCICIGLCLVLALSLLAACAPKKPTAGQPGAKTPAVTKTVTPTAPQTTAPKPTAPQTAAPAQTNQGQPAVPQNIADYVPMKVGNYWVYEGTGNEFASSTEKVLYKKGTRYQVMTDNGATVMANVFDVHKDRIVNTYREGEVYNNRNVLGKKSNINIIFLKAPIEKGTSWISEENSYEIVQTDAAVTVPAGSFTDCVLVKVTYKDKVSNMYYYIKNGVGVVQTEFRSEGQEPIIAKLKSYKINK